MSEFERQIYADMKSTDRISIWMIKCMELVEFSNLLTDEDIDGIAMVYKTMRKKDDPCKSWLYAGLYRQGDRIFSFQRCKRDRMRGTAIGKQREG